jgi:hypothetical protein
VTIKSYDMLNSMAGKWHECLRPIKALSQCNGLETSTSHFGHASDCLCFVSVLPSNVLCISLLRTDDNTKSKLL